jgi:hypothetical protein
MGHACVCPHGDSGRLMLTDKEAAFYPALLAKEGRSPRPVVRGSRRPVARARDSAHRPECFDRWAPRHSIGSDHRLSPTIIRCLRIIVPTRPYAFGYFPFCNS